MCFADQTLDTIGPVECESLRHAAREALPDHAFAVHANAEGMSWVVLDPPEEGGLRFTLCRIAPCLMVMAEMPGGQRRIVSTDSIADAIGFAQATVAEAPRATLH